METKKEVKARDEKSRRRKLQEWQGQDVKHPNSLEVERKRTRWREWYGKPESLDDKKNKKLGDFNEEHNED